MAFNKTSYAVGDVIIFTVSYEAKYWAGVWMPGKSYPVIRTTNTDTPEKKYGEQQHSWLFNGKTLTIAMKALKVGTVSCTLSVYSDDKYSVLEVAGTIAGFVIGTTFTCGNEKTGGKDLDPPDETEELFEAGHPIV